MFYVMSRLWADAPARRPDRGSYDRQGVWWTSGARFDKPIRTPIRVALKPYEERSPEESPTLPAFVPGVVPLMRTDLLEALHAAGVSNLDLYEAELFDPDSGEVFRDYKAVNVIGAVAAADMANSVAIVHDGIPAVDVSFDRLVIDPAKAGGLHLFRLAENLSAIIVDETVRAAVLRQGLVEIQFFKPENIAL